MTRSKKLFAATLLLTGGFGLAKFVGPPTLTQRQPADASASLTVMAPDQVPVLEPAPAESNAHAVLGGRSAAGILTNPASVATNSITMTDANISTDKANLGPNWPSAESNSTFAHSNIRPRGVITGVRTAGHIQAESPVTVDQPTVALTNRGSLHAPVAVTEPDTGLRSSPVQPTAAAVQSSYDAARPTGRVVAVTAADAAPYDGTELMRTHFVRDGDSLAKLAKLYLDDANRGHEIFELNRQVLTSADLLPIGLELRIPAK